MGLSTTFSSSFGVVLVPGRTRVPRPATGKTALRRRACELDMDNPDQPMMVPVIGAFWPPSNGCSSNNRLNRRFTTLFDRDGFRQIARLVHVRTLLHCGE